MIQKCWNPSPSFRPTFASLLKSNEFDKVLIDIMISAPNELGRTIWKKHFLEKVLSNFAKSDFEKDIYFLEYLLSSLCKRARLSTSNARSRS